MKIKLKSFIWSLFFICFCFTAKAQLSVPDSVRIGVGGEFGYALGIFGTGVNTQTATPAATAYKYGTGITFHIDYPLNKAFCLTGSAGYMIFFPTADALEGQQVILNTKIANFQIAPVKLGLKWFMGQRFYFQGEAGETFLANKSQLYALNSYAFTWSPQMGLIMPLKKKHTYIDAGVRFESFASFYNDGAVNNFLGLHVAYTFNL
jgi:hypothetical protein